MPGERYLYGDSDVAAERLGIVAGIFRETTRAFLEETVRERPALAIDLGCGPGHTTRLIQDVTGAARTLGLDLSERYVGLASMEAPPGVTFRVHDVREVPFPESPANVIYARLLLAHLNDPARVVARWATQLAPGGLVLLDELERPAPGDPRIERYLELAERVVASEGSTLFVGPSLATMADPLGTTRAHDAVAEFFPAPRDIARICRMNIEVLRERGELPADDPETESIARDLDEVIEERGGTATAWRVRQIALRAEGVG